MIDILKIEEEALPSISVGEILAQPVQIVAFVLVEKQVGDRQRNKLSNMFMIGLWNDAFINLDYIQDSPS